MIKRNRILVKIIRGHSLKRMARFSVTRSSFCVWRRHSPSGRSLAEISCLLDRSCCVCRDGAHAGTGSPQTGAGPETGPGARRRIHAKTGSGPETAAGARVRCRTSPATRQHLSAAGHGSASATTARAATARSSADRPSARQTQHVPQANRGKPRTPRSDRRRTPRPASADRSDFRRGR